MNTERGLAPHITTIQARIDALTGEVERMTDGTEGDAFGSALALIEAGHVIARRDGLIEAWCILTARPWPGPDLDHRPRSFRPVELPAGVILQLRAGDDWLHREGCAWARRDDGDDLVTEASLRDVWRATRCQRCKPEIPTDLRHSVGLG